VGRMVESAEILAWVEKKLGAVEGEVPHFRP